MDEVGITESKTTVAWVADKYLFPRRLTDGSRSHFLELLSRRRLRDGTLEYRRPTLDEAADFDSRNAW